MKYVSLFSGIEAASVAWEPIGWKPMAFAEIEPFPCAVLECRYPDVPNLGDVTKIDWSAFLERYGAVDLVCGGSPCQSFSIAGGRESLQGESRLMFEYIRAVRDLRPNWFLWENVPGVLSTRDNAFGQLLDEMEKLGYGLAWRTLDAQFFGVAQRRRRVFLVGHLGDMRAAAVLFESESVRGNTQSSKQKREELTRAVEGCPGACGFKWHQGSGAGWIGYEAELSPTCTADWHNPAVMCLQTDHMGQNGTNVSMDVCKTLDCASQTPVVCLYTGTDMACSLTARHNSSPCVDRGQNVICVADDNANAAMDYDMSGSLKVGGGGAP